MKGGEPDQPPAALDAARQGKVGQFRGFAPTLAGTPKWWDVTVTPILDAAEEAGVAFVRAATAGVDPRFVTMVRRLVLERAAVERGEEPERPALGTLGPSWDVCPVGCCANARQPGRPALCGSDPA